MLCDLRAFAVDFSLSWLEPRNLRHSSVPSRPLQRLVRAAPTGRCPGRKDPLLFGVRIQRQAIDRLDTEVQRERRIRAILEEDLDSIRSPHGWPGPTRYDHLPRRGHLGDRRFLDARDQEPESTAVERHQEFAGSLFLQQPEVRGEDQGSVVFDFEESHVSTYFSCVSASRRSSTVSRRVLAVRAISSTTHSPQPVRAKRRMNAIAPASESGPQ